MRNFSGRTVAARAGIFALCANTGFAAVEASFSMVWFVAEDERSESS